MKKPNGGADSKCRRTVAKLSRGGFQAEGRGFKSRRPLHKSPGLSRRFAHSRSQSLPEKIALPPLLEPPPIPKLALGRWKTIITYCVGLTVRGVKLPRPRFSVPLIAVVRGEAQFCWQWSDNHRRPCFRAKAATRCRTSARVLLGLYLPLLRAGHLQGGAEYVR